MSELEFIDFVRQNHTNHPAVLCGPGDDTAVLAASHENTLITTDMLMDGVHFKVADDNPAAIGRKALAVSLSDIAAMGGEAFAAFIAIALPRGKGEAFAEAVFSGTRSLAQEFAVAIAGGDTNSWQGPLVICSTVVGKPHRKGAVFRHGAKAGDSIFVTGQLGGSLASGHHLHFLPRLPEAKAILDHCDISAMIDLSDGLATDLRHICAESRCGAILDPDAIPLRPQVSLAQAVSDGEDFELLFTASEGQIPGLQDVALKFPITRIGYCTKEPGLFWHRAEGLEPINLSGYQHKF